MKPSKTYFLMAVVIIIPLGLVSGFFNNITLQVMASVWDDYPRIITLSTYTPDSLTIFLHNIGYIGVILVSIAFVAFIASITFVFKPQKANLINALSFITGTYILVISLCWQLVPMIVLAR